MKMTFFLLLLSFITLMELPGAEEARLLRYPNASLDQIAFSHAGDLYVVARTGGIARKITSSDGIEIYPRFSPDGKTLAFTGEYDGNREIYTMPSDGGEPVRITYSMDLRGLPERMGPDKIIMQWTNDGKKLLYRSRHEIWNAWTGKLYLVNLNGAIPEELPLPRGGFASYSPDGSKLAYNRIFREYRTWKRYRGGQADDIWIYDLKTKELKNITNNPAQDIIPMWYKDKIYFLSDRDQRMNIFCYNLTTNQLNKITNFDKYDVKFPSLGIDNIAFENGGYIYLLDPETDKFNKVTVQIADDYSSARTEIVDVSKRINSFGISPDGKRALFSARGDIFTVPAQQGNIRNLTKTSGIHERNTTWSPDGKWIAFISDETGEDEIFIVKPDGTSKTQLTKNSESYRFDLSWSPDSKKIACSDKSMKLYYVDIETKNVKQIAKSKSWELRDYAWSPDSKWFAYTDDNENSISVVHLYSLENDKTNQVTDNFFNCGRPEFDSKGRYLYFISDRAFNYSEGNFERSYVYNNMSQIYGLVLKADDMGPYKFQSDEAEIKGDSSTDKDDETMKSKKETKKDKETKKTVDLKIDLEGLTDRIFELPVKAGNYYGLTSIDGKLYYTSDGLYVWDPEKKDETQKVGDFNGYVISADGKNIIFRSDNGYYIEKLDSKVKPDKGKLDLADMKVELNRQEEWKQVFREAWRQMKYFFYDPKMHGNNWNKIFETYNELVPYVRHRDDLTYIMGEMIGELNCGHSYVGGGEMPSVKKVSIGLLGAEIEFDKSKGLFKFTKIFNGRNWDENTRSPLTEPGINVKSGDYLLELNGIKPDEINHPYKLLVDKAEKYVTIKVSQNPDDKNPREYTVKTISSESGLRYFDWVETNRKYVEQKSGGKIGYVHIPDMLSTGLNEFVKYFYPQIRKEALIIDDRYNGGGNVSPMIIERLRRILTMAGNARNQEIVTTLPSAVFTGPMVCMINELSASDGDMFPYQFRKSGLGKLIGKRTWGGVIGIRGSLPFLDGSYLNRPEFGHFSPEGEWVLEGVGAVPDIEIDNEPSKELSGIDQQLDKAIEVLLDELKTGKWKKLPSIPPHPDKSK
jgi:tricorn protease